MLSALEIAKKNGAKIVSINPLREAGLVAVQEPAEAQGRRRARHRAGRPAPADQAQRRPRAVPGDRRRCCVRVGRARPRLHRHATPPASTSGRRTSRAVDWDGRRRRDRAVPGADHRGRRRCSRDSDATVVLLGDGPDPAPQRGRHHQGGRQPRLRAGQHRQARRRACSRSAATPTCRATARWASGSGRREHFLDALQKEFGFDPPRRARPRHRRLDPRAARRQGARSSSGWAATSCRPSPDTEVVDRGDAQGRPDRADLDQAQPLAPGLRARPR